MSKDFGRISLTLLVASSVVTGFGMATVYRDWRDAAQHVTAPQAIQKKIVDPSALQRAKDEWNHFRTTSTAYDTTLIDSFTRSIAKDLEDCGINLSKEEIEAAKRHAHDVSAENALQNLETQEHYMSDESVQQDVANVYEHFKAAGKTIDEQLEKRIREAEQRAEKTIFNIMKDEPVVAPPLLPCSKHGARYDWDAFGDRVKFRCI